MAAAIHIITEHFPPVSGGLEQWTERLAASLADAQVDVTVYVCGEQNTYHRSQPDRLNQYTVELLSYQRSPWEGCLVGRNQNPDRMSLERQRVAFLCLRNAIARRRAEATRNILISNFAIGVGYLAHLISREVELPHISILAGTDFSRGFRNARERAVLREVCEGAHVVVAKSNEQASAIAREFRPRRLVVIPTSIPLPPLTTRLRKAEPVIFSDTGFSFKKGTSVLLDAYEELRRDGLPVRLVLCGATESGCEAYWEARQQATAALAPSMVEFPGFIDQRDVLKHLALADVYCSPTLGEGSSAGRAAAICSGIPIVTTRCGEVDAEIESASHISLVPTGDARGFKSALKAMCRTIMDSGAPVDHVVVRNARERFSEQREWANWLDVLDDVHPQSSNGAFE